MVKIGRMRFLYMLRPWFPLYMEEGGYRILGHNTEMCFWHMMEYERTDGQDWADEVSS